MASSVTYGERQSLCRTRLENFVTYGRASAKSVFAMCEVISARPVIYASPVINDVTTP
jgi:hypothetical protein